MPRNIRSSGLLLTAPILLLSACGDDGVGFTPTPTPSAGTPTPTPTPTPAAYAQALDFSQSWTKQVQMVLLETHYQPGPVYDYGVSTLFSDPTTVEVSYTAGDRQAAVTIGGQTWAFAASTIDSDDATGRLYKRSSGTLLSFLQPETDLKYVAWGNLSEPYAVAGSASRYFLFGASTRTADVPATGSVTYQARLVTTSPETDGGSGFEADIPVQIDYAAGTIGGAFTAVQTSAGSTGAPISMEMVLRGTYNAADGTFTGEVLSPCLCNVYGQFTGKFYGPEAKEIGLLVRFTIPYVPVVDVIGTIMGGKS